MSVSECFRVELSDRKKERKNVAPSESSVFDLSSSQLMAENGNQLSRSKYEAAVPVYYYKPTHKDCRWVTIATQITVCSLYAAAPLCV